MIFRANGKLLLTSEYLVVDGANALAIPCQFGQTLAISSNNSGFLVWKSYDNTRKVWFEAVFNNKMDISSCSDQKNAFFIQKLINSALKFSANKIMEGTLVNCILEFPQNWGLGSSSTLISLVAQWLNVDAFRLHETVSNGSGYDIACANAQSPILFSNKNEYSIENVQFSPAFKSELFFVHLNEKQISTNEVISYNEIKNEVNLEYCINTANVFTNKILLSNSISEFNEFIEQHESLLSHVLQQSTVKEIRFKDYSFGAIKSLGAWGGDFIMATGNKEARAYFKNKGYSTILEWDEMIIN